MKKLILLIVLAGFIGLLSVSGANAQDPNKPKVEPRIIGKVVVVKDAGGVITSVQIESRRLGTYNVVLDEKGKELGAKMEGKLVGVKATETEKDGKKWLTVESYNEIPRPLQNRGKNAPGGKKVPDGNDKK